MATPHIAAEIGAFAKTVLMPGDPLRSQFVAQTFLENARLVNNVRGIQGYTGTYKGTKVSVMASGMGMPSIGIYSYELYHFYDVDRIIRIGSAGGISDKVKLRDLVIGMGASTNSNYADQYNLPGTIAPIADYNLLRRAVEVAEEMKVPVTVGNILSSDVFYNADPTFNDRWKKMGILCVEMEAAALYLNAAYAGKQALCMLTISDHLYTGEALSSEDRQNSFHEMMQVALELA